ncbi:hypothetical protein KHA90_02715 [Flavobacterium psychroterrae]|uniref:Uncharacterized protein n=1 Tax=Flavobacterium psychroterrae TaxID=2133767 RepID=A0ABS5P7Q9_9FLAO|nr:hypothetical protein [Flavobacterium psychroterrae]MBS7229925.1 hypothetical protein [Flavobacterium psychroterrae]
MEINEIKKLQHLRKILSSYFNTLQTVSDKAEVDETQIKKVDYYELGCLITNMLKMCVLALEQDANKSQLINVSLILEMIIEMFPLDEFELLGELNQMLITDS